MIVCIQTVFLLSPLCYLYVDGNSSWAEAKYSFLPTLKLNFKLTFNFK